MAETYWPFDAGSGSASGEDRWYAMAPLWAMDGPTAAAGLLVTTLSGRNLQVAVGAAWVHGAYYVNDAALTVAIAANASGNPRIDRVVLRRDLTANTVAAAVVQGTPAGSPTVPALTQVATGVWEISLCQYRAETGFVNTDPTKLTDERRISGAAGAVYSPTKPGKRIHWSTTSSNTDGSGFATITHGAGFLPSQVQAWWAGNSLGGGPAAVAGTDTMTATTFRLRAGNSATAQVFAYVCYE